jgi:hypothetical protein
MAILHTYKKTNNGTSAHRAFFVISLYGTNRVAAGAVRISDGILSVICCSMSIFLKSKYCLTRVKTDQTAMFPVYAAQNEKVEHLATMMEIYLLT